MRNVLHVGLEFQGTASNGVRDTHDKALVPQVNCLSLLANGIQTYNVCKAMDVKGNYFVPHIQLPSLLFDWNQSYTAYGAHM